MADPEILKRGVQKHGFQFLPKLQESSKFSDKGKGVRPPCPPRTATVSRTYLYNDPLMNPLYNVSVRVKISTRI